MNRDYFLLKIITINGAVFVKRDEFIYNYWNDVTLQNAEKLLTYFTPDAYIKWHDSNEKFTVLEFIRANCEYPGKWNSNIERLEHFGDLSISVARVWSKDEAISCHVTSFLKFQDNKICELDEYWGEDGTAPQWRLDKRIGKAIK